MTIKSLTKRGKLMLKQTVGLPIGFDFIKVTRSEKGYLYGYPGKLIEGEAVDDFSDEHFVFCDNAVSLHKSGVYKKARFPITKLVYTKL